MKTFKLNLSLILLFCHGICSAAEPPEEVNALNYVQAKSSVHFNSVIARSGGINKWTHRRTLLPIERQPIKRMNRDTLYSSAVIDITKGASITLPNSGSRYLSATVVNENHYINRIYHKAGTHKLDREQFDTPYVLVTVRILLDESDPKDIMQAHKLQDELVIQSNSSKNYTHANYEQDSFKATTESLLKLAAKIPDANNTFGKKENVNSVRHLLASAYGWGGLPETEATYINVQPNLSIGAYTLNIKDVPVNGFWSISLYNKDGYFEKNEYHAYSVNNLTAVKNSDDSVTVHFGGDPSNPNFLPITEGWNYVVRMYRPKKAILENTWKFPSIKKTQ